MISSSVLDKASIWCSPSGRYPGGANPCDTIDDSPAHSNGKAPNVECPPVKPIVVDDQLAVSEGGLNRCLNSFGSGRLAPVQPNQAAEIVPRLAENVPEPIGVIHCPPSEQHVPRT